MKYQIAVWFLVFGTIVAACYSANTAAPSDQAGSDLQDSSGDEGIEPSSNASGQGDAATTSLGTGSSVATDGSTKPGDGLDSAGEQDSAMGDRFDAGSALSSNAGNDANIDQDSANAQSDSALPTNASETSFGIFFLYNPNDYGYSRMYDSDGTLTQIASVFSSSQ